MNIKDTAENIWFKLSFRVAMIMISLLVANWEYEGRAQTQEIKTSISRLNGTLDDFRQKEFNPLSNAVTILQTTIDKGINQALESTNRRLEVLERRVDSLSDRVNELGQERSAKR